MTDLRAAAQQALEALNTLYRTLTPETPLAKSLKQRADALRAALAEPDVPETDFGNMEPVAWLDPASGEVISVARYEVWKREFGLAGKGNAARFTVPLYTAPPQRPAETVERGDAAEAVSCNPHPKAPHGFLRNASHTEDRYVCECEYWDPYDAGYQAGMESAMRMESEGAHILEANPDSSQDVGGLIGCVGHDCKECRAQRDRARRIVTYVCPVCAASLERQE